MTVKEAPDSYIPKLFMALRKKEAVVVSPVNHSNDHSLLVRIRTGGPHVPASDNTSEDEHR